MLFHIYQVFSSLQGYLQFFVHFFFIFMEHFFIDHPISLQQHPVITFFSIKAEMGSRGCPWAGSNGEKWSNIPFLVIYHRLCLLMGNHFAPSLLLLIKMLSLAAVAMISVKRKSLQAISTLFSQCLPKNSTFGHFWLFFTICACSWATPWSHLRYYWQKYHWVLLQ